MYSDFIRSISAFWDASLFHCGTVVFPLWDDRMPPASSERCDPDLNVLTDVCQGSSSNVTGSNNERMKACFTFASGRKIRRVR